MGTTDLFVELIVIGVGGAIWLLLLIFSAFGYDWVPLEDMFSLAALIPFLSVVYVLGIVVDRLADAAFGKLWETALRERFYAKEEEYLDDRRVIYIHPSRLGDLLEYARSRLRICRGWTLNALLTLISLDIFIWSRVTDATWTLWVFSNLALGLFALGNWFSWRQLSLASFRKIKAQSTFLRAVQSASSAPQDTL